MSSKNRYLKSNKYIYIYICASLPVSNNLTNQLEIIYGTEAHARPAGYMSSLIYAKSSKLRNTKSIEYDIIFEIHSIFDILTPK